MVKQFLRYIFTLAAMLMMVVGDAWAQNCTYQIQSLVSKITSPKNGRFPQSTIIGYVDNTYGISKVTVDIALERTAAGKDASVKFEYSTDGSNWIAIASQDLDGTTWGTGDNSLNVTYTGNIDSSNKIQFRVYETKQEKYGGSRTINISNFNVTMASTLQASPSTWNFGSIQEGSPAQTKNDFSISYSNIGSSISASSNNPEIFSVSSSPISTDCDDVVPFSITFNPKTSGKHTGEITLRSSTGKETKITLSGTATGAPIHRWDGKTEYYVDESVDLSTWFSSNEHGARSYEIVSFSPDDETGVTPTLNGTTIKLTRAGKLTVRMKQNAYDIYSYKETDHTIIVNKYDLSASIAQESAVWNELIDNAFSVSYGLQDYTVTSSNTNIAQHISGNKIQTYFTSGTAQFQINRPEDYKYNALNQTLLLSVNPNTNGCNLIENQKTSASYEFANTGATYSSSFSLNDGIGDKLTFSYNLTENADYNHYLTPQYSLSNDGDFNDIPDLIFTTKSSTPTTESITLPEGTKRIRFKRTSEFMGTKSFSISNITVTRKTFLTPQIDDDTFYLTQVSSGMQFAGTFPLEWSTCSDEIRFSCDNPNFVIEALDSNNQPKDYIDASNKQGTTSIIVTYSANTANPVLTGELTIYDQSQTKTITLSCEHLTQTIDWPQYFHNLEADEEGVINQDFTLNAIARAVNGQPTNQPIKYTLSVSPSENAQLSSDGRLIITGICEGTITASVEGFTDATSGITYSANSLTRQIRIRKAGTLCETYALEKWQEQTIGNVWPAVVYDITGLPTNTMTFKAHAEVASLWNNEIKIDFKYNSDDQDWVEEQIIPIEASSVNKTYTCYVPDNVKQVRFRSESSARSYFHDVKLRQKTYITPSVPEITINTLVNQPFEYSFTVDYSDVPLIEYSVTNSNNLNLTLTPTTEINNNCGEHGTYTFILRGTSPYPQTGVKEYITITTSAHKDNPKIIPVIITSTLGDTYYFNQQAGDWGNLSNWQVNGIKPSSLPTPSNPVYISKAVTVGANDAAFEGIAYSITIETGGSINVLPKGGLTVHAGGFTGADENNLTLHNKKDGAGFIRISPYCTNVMPTVKVLYETTSTLDKGANELAVWQYIGAPGADCQFTVDYITWLYHWSETQGWINKTGTLTLEPFAGYAITQYGKPTYELVAKPINTNQTITLTKTDTGSGMDGDNLFANSFMAPIDVKNFKKEDFEGDIEATFYLFNSGSYSEWADHNNNNNTLGNNHSVSPGQYCAIPALAAQYLPNDFDITTIPPMQGVYVIANADGASIKLNYDKHVWKAGSAAGTNMHEPMRAPSHNVFKPDNFRRLRIQVNSANSGADRMYIIQDTITTTDYDNGYDAPNQLAEGLANIYTNEHFGQMEVSCSNHIDSTFVGFTAGLDSIYTLRFNAIIGDDLHLLDLDNDSLILLEEDATYTFHATPHSKNDLRFQILLHPEKNLDFGKEEKDEIYTGITDVHTTQVWSHGSSIYISNAPTNTIATLYNISGHKLLTTPIHHTPYTLDLSYLPKGVYMLQLNTQVYKFVIQ